jgi:hypothetical protein
MTESNLEEDWAAIFSAQEVNGSPESRRMEARTTREPITSGSSLLLGVLLAALQRARLLPNQIWKFYIQDTAQVCGRMSGCAVFSFFDVSDRFGWRYAVLSGKVVHGCLHT